MPGQISTTKSERPAILSQMMAFTLIPPNVEPEFFPSYQRRIPVFTAVRRMVIHEAVIRFAANITNQGLRLGKAASGTAFSSGTPVTSFVSTASGGGPPELVRKMNLVKVGTTESENVLNEGDTLYLEFQTDTSDFSLMPIVLTLEVGTVLV